MIKNLQTSQSMHYLDMEIGKGKKLRKKWRGRDRKIESEKGEKEEKKERKLKRKEKRKRRGIEVGIQGDMLPSCLGVDIQGRKREKRGRRRN